MGGVAHHHDTVGDEFAAQRADADVVHLWGGAQRVESVAAAPDPSGLADLCEVVGEQRIDPVDVRSARRIEQLEFARDNPFNVVVVVVILVGHVLRPHADVPPAAAIRLSISAVVTVRQ